MTTHHEQTRELRALLTAQYPNAFPLDASLIRPLKINVHLDIRAAHPETDPLLLRRVLSRWCSRPVYQWTLAHGGVRVDLQGQPAGEVTPEQQAHARERLQAIAEKRKQQRQAAATNPVEARTAVTPAPTPEPDPRLVQAPIRPLLKLRKAPGEDDDQGEREGIPHA